MMKSLFPTRRSVSVRLMSKAFSISASGSEARTGNAAVNANSTKRPRRIFSGIQPTGQIHLGNYFGAIRQWISFQEEKKNGKYEQCIYSVVDLHAITVPQNRDNLQRSILEATATLLACGIDPEESILFLQSHVSLHSQLSWVLGCLTTMPRLGQLPQFKEKSKAMKEIPIGLYTYPVLQAADVLLYNATDVPIGEDNVQHIQLAQHLASRFNRIHGDTFQIPKAIIEDGMWNRLRSLRSPEHKMSKSEPDPKSRICLVDSPEDIIEKFKKSMTDFTSKVTYDPEARPGVSNLVQIHSLCTGQTVEEICRSVEHLDTGKYKLVVAGALIEFLKPIRNQILNLLQDPQYLMSVLQVGSERATALAQPVWDTVCHKVGISPQPNWFPQASTVSAKVDASIDTPLEILRRSFGRSNRSKSSRRSRAEAAKIPASAAEASAGRSFVATLLETFVQL